MFPFVTLHDYLLNKVSIVNLFCRYLVVGQQKQAKQAKFIITIWIFGSISRRFTSAYFVAVIASIHYGVSFERVNL